METRTESEEDVELPEDVLIALKEKPGALEAFKALPISKQRELLEPVNNATMSGMRDGRIERLITKLSE